MEYRIYKNSSLIATTGSKTYILSGLTPATSYQLGVAAYNGQREGPRKTITVSTRGVRLLVDKDMTVGGTVTLHYQEYSLGLVPIGTEPKGMFGGGNRQVLSAKVTSSTNGQSVIELQSNFTKMPENTKLILHNGVYSSFVGYKAIYLK